MTDAPENKTQGTPETKEQPKTSNDLIIEELRKQNELLTKQNEQLSQANNDLWAILHPADNRQQVVDRAPKEKQDTPYDIVADVTAKLKAL